MKNAKPKKKTWKEEYLGMCGLKADLEVRLNDVARDRDRAEKELERVRFKVTELSEELKMSKSQILQMQDMLGHLCAQVCKEKAIFEHMVAENNFKEKEMPF